MTSGIGARLGELAAIAALVLAYSTVDPDSHSSWTMPLNFWGPVWLGTVLLGGAWRIAREVPDGLWMGLFWFRVATAVYFCLGSLVPLLASESTRLYLEDLFAFQPHQILELNLITAVSVLTVLGTSASLEVMFKPRARVASRGIDREHKPQSYTVVFAIAFIALGGAIKYFLLFPNQMGWIHVVVPGVLVTLSNSTLVGYFLLTIWCLDGRLRYVGIVLVLVAIEMAVGLLTFNKSSVLLPMIFVGLGFLRGKVTIARSIATVTAISAAIFVLQPLVSQARLFQAQWLGSGTASSIDQRLEMLQASFDDVPTAYGESRIDQVLARVSYVNTGTFVIDQYDQGQPGNSFDGLLTMLVPRFLWPDKPVYQPGADLWLLMTGRYGNQVGAGVFAEAYWNFGWAGVVLSMMLLGAILFWLSRMVSFVMERQAWIYTPILFMGMYMGVRVDGSFVVDVYGEGAIALAIAGVCSLLNVFLRGSRRDLSVSLKPIGILARAASSRVASDR